MNFNAINVDGVRWGVAALDAGQERRHAHQAQIAKGRTSLENLPWSHPLWLPVLVEEVGEVARALNDGEPLGRLRAEVVQVAAMALAYADAIQEAMEAEVLVDTTTPERGQRPWHQTGPHDDQCESEFIDGPMAYTPCACRDRAAQAKGD